MNMAEMEYNIHIYVLIVFNHLKVRIMCFPYLKMIPFIYAVSGSSSTESAMLNHHDFTVDND